MRLAAPMPLKKVSGTEITSAQGQEITRKVSARRIHSIHWPSNREGITASSSAARHTRGVYTFAKRVMNRSVLALAWPEFSTRSRIFATVDSPYTLLTRTVRRPDRFTQPLTTLSPACTSRGRASPVRATVFRLEEPVSTTPSRGTFSPGLMRMVSPTATSSGSTVRICPSASIRLA